MDDDAHSEPPGPKQLPRHPDAVSVDRQAGSTASNGYWLHDNAGPRAYVPPSVELSGRISEILNAVVPGLRCTVEAGQLCVHGTVESDDQAREIRRLVQDAEPGLSVVNRLFVATRGSDVTQNQAE